MRKTSERSARVGIHVYKDGEMAVLVDGSSKDATEALIYALALTTYRAKRPGVSLMEIASDLAGDILHELRYIQTAEMLDIAKRHKDDGKESETA